ASRADAAGPNGAGATQGDSYAGANVARNGQNASTPNRAPAFGAQAPNGSAPLRSYLQNRTTNHVLGPGGRPDTRNNGVNGASGSTNTSRTGDSPRAKEDVIHGFSQGHAGNCVSVAAIKSAMTRFGSNNIFKDVQKTNSGYDVTMRDNFKLKLSNQ